MNLLIVKANLSVLKWEYSNLIYVNNNFINLLRMKISRVICVPGGHYAISYVENMQLVCIKYILNDIQ